MCNKSNLLPDNNKIYLTTITNKITVVTLLPM